MKNKKKHSSKDKEEKYFYGWSESEDEDETAFELIDDLESIVDDTNHLICKLDADAGVKSENEACTTTKGRKAAKAKKKETVTTSVRPKRGVDTNTKIEGEQDDPLPFFDCKAVEMCARKVARFSGDVRKCLDICRQCLDEYEYLAYCLNTNINHNCRHK